MEDVLLIACRGDLDTRQAFEPLRRVIDRHGPRVVLDLAACPFVGSGGLGALIRAQIRLRELGGDLVIARPRTQFCRTIDLLGLRGPLRVFASDDEALAQLGSTEDAAAVAARRVVVETDAYPERLRA